MFRVGGRGSGTITLYVEGTNRDDEARRKWKKYLEDAIGARHALLASTQVFDLRLLVDPDTRREVISPVASLGRILCSCSFSE